MGAPMFAMLEERKMVDTSLGQHGNAAAVSAVSAVRPAARHVFFTSEAETAVSAVSALHANDGSINKHENRGE